MYFVTADAITFILVTNNNSLMANVAKNVQNDPLQSFPPKCSLRFGANLKNNFMN